MLAAMPARLDLRPVDQATAELATALPAGTVGSRTVWFSHEAGKREVCDMAGAYSTAGYVAFRISAPGGVAHATAAARKMKRQPQA
jgi:hypothetical protein